MMARQFENSPLLKKINIPTFAHWNYCSALPMVEPPHCSERYTNCSSIIYMYTQRVRSEWYTNHSQMAQHRFAISSTHMRILFVNHLARSCIRGFRYRDSLQMIWKQGEWAQRARLFDPIQCRVREFIGSSSDRRWNLYTRLDTLIKQSTMIWKTTDNPPPLKFSTWPLMGKMIAAVFWDQEGVLLIDYLLRKILDLQKRPSVTPNLYFDTPIRLY